MGGILLCLDGAAHTQAALQWAVEAARTRGVTLTGLHVKDPYLKKFYNELYSQGRKEYLEHVERCLTEQAELVMADFNAACATAGIDCTGKVRDGDPVEAIIAELDAGAYDMLVLGGKRLGWFGRFRSRKLPLQVQRRVSLPCKIVLSPPAAAQSRAAHA